MELDTDKGCRICQTFGAVPAFLVACEVSWCDVLMVRHTYHYRFTICITAVLTNIELIRQSAMFRLSRTTIILFINVPVLQSKSQSL